MAKTVALVFRCTFLEREALRAQAKEAGLKPAAFIRQRLFEGYPAPPVPSSVLQIPEPPPPQPKPVKRLCPRCYRIGVPTCPSCRHLFFGTPLPDSTPTVNGS